MRFTKGDSKSQREDGWMKGNWTQGISWQSGIGLFVLHFSQRCFTSIKAEFKLDGWSENGRKEHPWNRELDLLQTFIT